MNMFNVAIYTSLKIKINAMKKPIVMVLMNIKKLLFLLAVNLNKELLKIY